MFLSLLNKKEMLKFLDLAIYMVDIDGEPTQYEKRILNKMIAELDEIKDEYSFRLTDSVEIRLISLLIQTRLLKM